MSKAFVDLLYVCSVYACNDFKKNISIINEHLRSLSNYIDSTIASFVKAFIY